MTGQRFTQPDPLPDVTTISDVVSEVVCRVVSDLANIRAKHGDRAGQIEAIGMRAAASAVLQTVIGIGGIRRIMDEETVENDRLAAREGRKRVRW